MCGDESGARADTSLLTAITNHRIQQTLVAGQARPAWVNESMIPSDLDSYCRCRQRFSKKGSAELS